MIKTIGVLTSGGDAPGMNAAVRAVVRAALKKGMTVYGVKRGYCGLLEDDIEPMDEMSVAGIISRGGTMLYTARSAEFRTEQGVLKAKATCEKYGLEGLVVIGGDGSFRGAADLSAHGILCVGLPGTIDNDIACTDYTIGYDTAMNTAMELMDKLSDTSQSHYRCSVVEVMGRGAGYIALNTGVASGALEIITKPVQRCSFQSKSDLGQYRTKIVQQMRRQIFWQMTCKAVRRALCSVSFILLLRPFQHASARRLPDLRLHTNSVGRKSW